MGDTDDVGIKIGKNVNKIEMYAFEGCSKLTKTTYNISFELKIKGVPEKSPKYFLALMRIDKDTDHSSKNKTSVTK